MPYRIKHLIEAAALILFGTILRILPYRLALALTCLLARLAFSVFRFRREEAERRIREVLGPDLPPRKVSNIAWLSCRNISFSFMEMFRLDKMTAAWIARVSNAQDILPTLQAHSQNGMGGIIAVPHMGSWELAEVAVHRAGIPIFNIAAKQKNPLADRYINHLRRAPGIETIARGSGTMKEVVRRLKSGQFLAILPDVRVREPGVSVPVFGKPANLGKGMALFARHTHVPVFPAIVRRIGWAKQHFTLFDPVWPDPSLDKHEDAARMTREVMAKLEPEILANPEQWFWYNKRWLLDPLPPAAGAATTNTSADKIPADKKETLR